MPTLLVIDDEPNVIYSVQKGLRSSALDVIGATTARQGIDRVREQPPDAVILDVRLPDMSGLEAFDHIRAIDPRVPVIVITAYATTETAIEAMKRGAFEYLLKPVEFHHLREVVAKALALSRMRSVPATFEDAAAAGEKVDRIVGPSAAMQSIYKQIGRVAPQDVTVLILGENGTGKELIARAIYNHSARKGKPFLTINCAAIPEALLESELFGHERGAFTGADRRRIGKFEQAHNGTLFLDEIGDMAVSTQARILRLLQEQRFERVGSNETIQTDVRLIAATNQDLEARVASGRFRQDLFYRLNGFTLRLPPLRERLDDLPNLVDHFITQFNEKLGKQVRSVDAETMQRLRSHSWPGNVRELQSAIRYALVQATGEALTEDCLPGNLSSAGARLDPEPGAAAALAEVARHVTRRLAAGEPDLYRTISLAMDRVLLQAALRQAHGSQVKASELLGISRTTLRAKLRALGLAVEKQPPTEDVICGQELYSA